MAAIPTLGSFDPPTTTADENALEEAARSLDANSGRILGQGTDVVARMDHTAVEFSDLVSEPIKRRGGEFLSAATSAMEGAVWGSTVTVQWAGSVREFKEAVKALVAEWGAAVDDKFGIRESEVGGGTPNLTPAEREAAAEQATAYAGQLKLAELNAAANAAYEKFKGDAADAGARLKEGPTPENLRALAAGGGVDTWALYTMFGMNAPLPLTGSAGEWLGQDLLDAIRNGRVADIPPELRGQLGALQALIERAHHLQSIGEGELSAGELAYLESFFGTIDKSIFDMPDLLDDETNWSGADQALILGGMGGGLLVLSNENLGGGTSRLSDSVKNFVAAYVGGKGKGTDLRPQHHDGDELRSLAKMFDAVDDQGMALLTGGKEFSGALTTAVALHLDGEAGGYSIGEGTARTILDHSTANFEANAALLNGDLQHPYYQKDTAEAVLRGLFGHRWQDGGETASKFVDWIPRMSVSDDPAMRELATESAFHLIDTMTSQEKAGPWNESAYKFFTDSYGKIGQFEAAPIGVANPLIAQSLGRTAIAYIDYFDLPDVDGQKNQLFDDGRPEQFYLDKDTRLNFFELVMGDMDAGNELGKYAYAKIIGEAGGMTDGNLWDDPYSEGVEDGRLIGLLDKAYQRVYEDATDDKAGVDEMTKQHSAWTRAASTVLKEIVTEIPVAKQLWVIGDGNSKYPLGNVLIKELFEVGKVGPPVSETFKLWPFAGGEAPTAESREGAPEYDKFGFTVRHSVVENLLADKDSGVDIDDVRRADPNLVEKGADGEYRLRSAEELLKAFEANDGRPSFTYGEAGKALWKLMDDDLRQRWQDYIDTFPEQRREESD
jgi:hypothetical protein